MTSDDLTLWYDNVLIGHVTGTYYSDETWWGILIRVVHADDGELGQRLLSFIYFCEDWNERYARDPANPPSATEFDSYSDVLKSGLWFVRNANGEQLRIGEAPLFYAGEEICWRLESQKTGS